MRHPSASRTGRERPPLPYRIGTAAQRGIGAITCLVAAGVVVHPRMPNNRYPPLLVALLLLTVLVGTILLGLVPTGLLARPTVLPPRLAAWLARPAWLPTWLRVRPTWLPVRAAAVLARPAAVLARPIRRSTWPRAWPRTWRCFAHPIGSRWDLVAGACCLLNAALAALVGIGGGYRYGWDAAVLRLASAQPAGRSRPALVAYFSYYPNMLPFLAVARTVRSWAAAARLDYDTAFAVLNAGSLLVTSILVYLMVRLLRGPRRAVSAVLILGALLDTSPWLSVPYTDLAALWTPIAAIGLSVLAIRRPGPIGVAGLAGAGAVLAFGYDLKVTPVVGLLAVPPVLATLLVRADRRSRRWLLAGGVALLAGFLLTDQAVLAWSRSGAPPIVPDRARAPLAYVADGVRVQHLGGGAVAFGAFDPTVTADTRGRPTAVQNRIADRLIRRELADRGLLGTTAFYLDKTAFNWGDGMFWARGEGGDQAAPSLRHGSPATAVNAWVAPRGRLFGAHVVVAEVVWLIVLTWLGAGLLRSRYRPETLLMALTVAGIALFLLIFQGRSRYLLGHLPVLVALATTAGPPNRRIFRVWGSDDRVRPGDPPGTSPFRERSRSA